MKLKWNLHESAFSSSQRLSWICRIIEGNRASKNDLDVFFIGKGRSLRTNERWKTLCHSQGEGKRWKGNNSVLESFSHRFLARFWSLIFRFACITFSWLYLQFPFSAFCCGGSPSPKCNFSLKQNIGTDCSFTRVFVRILARFSRRRRWANPFGIFRVKQSGANPNLHDIQIFISTSPFTSSVSKQRCNNT